MPPPDNILIYRLGSLGDTVVALPCFHLIRNLYPRSRIVILTNEPVSGKAAPALAVLEHSGLCDQAVSYPVGTRSTTELVKVRQAIRKMRPELMVNLAAGRGWLKSLRDYLFFRSCGIKRIVGTPWRRRDLRVRRLPEGEFEPECQRLAARLSSLGVINLADQRFWDLKLTRAERHQASGLLPTDHRQWLAVSVGTKHPAKDWGEENWDQLLGSLSRKMSDASLLLLGAADEWARSERLSRVWTGRRLNLCGQPPARVSAAIFERARLFIGHDSGPMHLAAAVGTPTLGLFSWFNPPGQWFPGHRSWKQVKVLYPALPAGGWSPALQTKCGADAGIRRLPVEAVSKSALELWAANPRAPIPSLEHHLANTIIQ